MRLCVISGTHPLQLCESISKQDFFDFYSLLAAHQEPHLKHKPLDDEIAKRLKYEASYIFKDQMDQLFAIVAERLYESGDDGDTGLAAFYQSWGIEIVPNEHDPDIDSPNKASLLAMPWDKRAKFLSAVNERRRAAGTKQWFTSVDGTWSKLADKYTELAHTPDNLQSLIRAIDRIYGLCHHGGMLVDYFDEHDWLEDALHIRSAGDPAQFLRYASSDVQSLVKSAIHGVAQPEVTAIQKLRLALNKAIGDVGHAKLNGDRIEFTATLSVYMRAMKSDNHTMHVVTANPRSIYVTTDGDVQNLGNANVTGEIYLDRTGEIHLNVDGKQYSGKQLGMFSGRRPTDYERPSRAADKLMVAIRSAAIAQFEADLPAGVMRM